MFMDPSVIGAVRKIGKWICGRVLSVEEPMLVIDLSSRNIMVKQIRLRYDHDTWQDAPFPNDACSCFALLLFVVFCLCYCLFCFVSLSLFAIVFSCCVLVWFCKVLLFVMFCFLLAFYLMVLLIVLCFVGVLLVVYCLVLASYGELLFINISCLLLLIVGYCL